MTTLGLPTTLEFKVLGPLEIVRNGQRVAVTARKMRAVLTILLIARGQVVSSDRLIDELWGDEPPAQATGTLHVYISNLRRLVEPERSRRDLATVLVSRPTGYALVIEPGCFDAAMFESGVEKGLAALAAGSSRVAYATLTGALGLWRGPALSEFAFEPFARNEASRLEELRIVAAEARMGASLALGEHKTAVVGLRELVAAHPLREGLWAALVVALYRSGRQGDALRACSEARAILAEELGVEPGPALRHLEAEVLAHGPSLDWQPPSTEDQARNVATAPVEAPRFARPSRAAMVGRKAELGRLQVAFDRIDDGHGGVVLVSGEPGIGKTRLVDELAAWATDSGALVVWGRVDEGEGAPPYWPWIQLLKAVLTGCERDLVVEAIEGNTDVIATIHPEVTEIVAGVAPPPMLGPAEARFRLHRAVADFFGSLSRRQRLVVLLEDLHWADVASLELTRFVATTLATAAILLVVTYRSIDAGHSDTFDDVLGSLARHPMLERILLGGLTESEVGRFITQTVDVEASVDAVSAVHARTEGNPFFVAELARLLQSEGRFAGSSGSGSAPATVPVGVRDVVHRRLARLPTVSRDVLALGAVIGRDFDLTVLAPAANLTVVESLHRIAPAVDAGLASQDPSSMVRFRFSHALVRDTIYGELSALRKATLHAEVGAALEARHGAARSDLAWHFFQAAAISGPERGVRYALEAASAAEATLAYERAEHELRRALTLVELWPAGPDRLELESVVQNRLAMLLTTTQGFSAPQAAQAWTRSRQLLSILGRGRELLMPLFGLFLVHCTLADYKTATEIGQQLLDLGEAVGDPALRLAGHDNIGMTSLLRGDLVAARDHLERSLALTAGFDDASLLRILPMHPGGFASVQLAIVYHLMGDEAHCSAARAHAKAVSDRLDHPLSVGAALILDLWLQGCHDSRPELADDATEASKRCREWGLMEMVSIADFWEASAWQERDGRDRTGRLNELIASMERAGYRIWRTQHLATLAQSYWQLGDIDQALHRIDEGLAVARRNDEHFWEPELLRLRGEMLSFSDRTRLPEAIEAVKQAIALAEAQGSTTLLRRARTTLATLEPTTADGAPAGVT